MQWPFTYNYLSGVHTLTNKMFRILKTVSKGVSYRIPQFKLCEMSSAYVAKWDTVYNLLVDYFRVYA